MAGRTVRAWLLRCLLVVGAAGAVTVMHSLPVASHDRPEAASFAQAVHVVTTADLMGHEPLPPDGEHHGLEHLCLATLTAVAVSIALALLRRLWRTTSRTTGALSPRWGDPSPPPRRPPSLTRLCVLRL